MSGAQRTRTGPKQAKRVMWNRLKRDYPRIGYSAAPTPPNA